MKKQQSPTDKSINNQVRRLPLFFLGVLILIIAVAISYYWTNQVEVRQPREIRKTLPLVEIQPVVLSTNRAKLSAGGFVSAHFSSNIAAEVNGTVLSVSEAFAVGQSVQKGQVLATIDNRNYVAALATAKANLANAKSNFAQEQAQSKQAVRDAKKFSTKPSDLTLRKPQLAAAQAAVENAKAQLVLATENLDKTKIKAPFDAVIQARNIAPADSVTVNSVVAQLISTEIFTVKLTLSGDDFKLLSLDNEVELNNSNSNQIYHAKISRFDPSLNANTRTAAVYVDIEQPLQGQQVLLLNSYLTATIIGKKITDSMWINNQSIVNNQFVWTKQNDDTLSKASITVLYRGEKQSLVQFNQAISGFVAKPKDSFFAGAKVSSHRQSSKPHPSSPKKSGKQGVGRPKNRPNAGAK